MKIKELQDKAYKIVETYIKQCPDLTFLIEISRTKDAGNEWVPLVIVSFGRYDSTNEWQPMFIDKEGNATYEYKSSNLFECFFSWIEGDIED